MYFLLKSNFMGYLLYEQLDEDAYDGDNDEQPDSPHQLDLGEEPKLAVSVDDLLYILNIGFYLIDGLQNLWVVVPAFFHYTLLIIEAKTRLPAKEMIIPGDSIIPFIPSAGAAGLYSTKINLL
mgnify:CR=1 FL=1